MIRTGLLASAILLGSLPPTAAGDGPPTLEPVGAPYAVGDLRGEKRKRKEGYAAAEDVSGIACLPATSGPRRCLIVNDQNTQAQFATIDGARVAAGDLVDLIGQGASASTLGAPPARHDCSGGVGGFSDLDGEGVAYAAPYFYVVGSHGCSRKDRQFNLSAFILARFRVDETGARVGEPVETTYRLSDALTGADTVGPFFAHDLQSEASANGLNIEGLAVVGERVFLGLRAPSIDGVGYIVETALGDLFAPGHDRLKVKPRTIPVAIGRNAGIRDLAVLPDGRLLVLTGPAQKQVAPYDLFAVEPTGGAVEPIGRLADLRGGEKDGKAEAVALLGPGRILVLFDSLENGAPREYRLP